MLQLMPNTSMPMPCHGDQRGVDVRVEDLHLGVLVDGDLGHDGQMYDRPSRAWPVRAHDGGLHFENVLLRLEEQHVGAAVDQAAHLVRKVVR
jgi:hypothetical protein